VGLIEPGRWADGGRKAAAGQMRGCGLSGASSE
jgi:hypothetical protein